MKTCKHKTGVTLVEMLIVVAVIAILATIVIGIASRLENRAKEQLTEGTIAILTAALGQFHDYGYRYEDNPVYLPDEREFYLGLKFPLDCNDYLFTGDPLNLDLATTLGKVLGATNVITSGTHDPNYSGSEALCFFLNRVPESRKTLEKVDSSLITNKDSNRQDMNITITFPDSSIKVYPLLRIIDPWGTALRYDYYNEWELNFILRDRGKRTFPVITSAGPDGIFGTVDDITSR